MVVAIIASDVQELDEAGEMLLNVSQLKVLKQARSSSCCIDFGMHEK